MLDHEKGGEGRRRQVEGKASTTHLNPPGKYFSGQQVISKQSKCSTRKWPKGNAAGFVNKSFTFFLPSKYVHHIKYQRPEEEERSHAFGNIRGTLVLRFPHSWLFSGKISRSKSTEARLVPVCVCVLTECLLSH